MSSHPEVFWYIPNTSAPGHRGDDTTDHDGLPALLEHARAVEQHGWRGALLGTGWGRPDTFTVATALAALTQIFEPLIAVRPGYWQPAHLASAVATLDRLSGGRVRINVVSGRDDLAAYGDAEGDQEARYARTKEFLQLVRRLWSETDVTYAGEYFGVVGSTVLPRIERRPGRPHPTLYFGGASAAAERVAATEADVQLFWGEPLDGVAERIDRLRSLSEKLGREHAPLQFGLRVTTLVRDTSAQAWADAEAKVAALARDGGHELLGPASVGQQRLRDLHARGDVLDTNLYTRPGAVGGAAAGATWLVGSAREVATALHRYLDLGVTHLVLSDTPYLHEVARQGTQLLPLLHRTEKEIA